MGEGRTGGGGVGRLGGEEKVVGRGGWGKLGLWVGGGGGVGVLTVAWGAGGGWGEGWGGEGKSGG